MKETVKHHKLCLLPLFLFLLSQSSLSMQLLNNSFVLLVVDWRTNHVLSFVWLVRWFCRISVSFLSMVHDRLHGLVISSSLYTHLHLYNEPYMVATGLNWSIIVVVKWKNNEDHVVSYSFLLFGNYSNKASLYLIHFLSLSFSYSLQFSVSATVFFSLVYRKSDLRPESILRLFQFEESERKRTPKHLGCIPHIWRHLHKIDPEDHFGDGIQQPSPENSTDTSQKYVYVYCQTTNGMLM